MPPAELLTRKLPPVDDALARMREIRNGAPCDPGEAVPDVNVLAALEGLTEIVRHLAQHKWVP
jgi:hypothetical protein